MVTSPKPDPAPSLLALDRLGAQPDRALHLGDEPADEDGARSVGMSFLAAPADDRTTWLERWDSRIRLPNAIRIAFLPSKQPDPIWLTPLVVQIPAGRTL